MDTRSQKTALAITDPEIRAQAAESAGTSAVNYDERSCRLLLNDAEPRVRIAAALALAQVPANRESRLDPAKSMRRHPRWSARSMLRDNDDQDAVLASRRDRGSGEAGARRAACRRRRTDKSPPSGSPSSSPSAARRPPEVAAFLNDSRPESRRRGRAGDQRRTHHRRAAEARRPASRSRPAAQSSPTAC